MFITKELSKFTKIRLKYYFSSIPSKVMDKYGQVEIEPK